MTQTANQVCLIWKANGDTSPAPCLLFSRLLYAIDEGENLGAEVRVKKKSC